jgi:hypothetical protein
MTRLHPTTRRHLLGAVQLAAVLLAAAVLAAITILIGGW